METILHFCSGLPRAGSTLLMNILAQNPRFHCTPTSALVDICMMLKNGWDKIEPNRAIPTEAEREDLKLRTIRGAIRGFFSGVEKPVIVDKSRGWLAEMEMMALILGYKPKVLVCVRDMRDVVASFELLYRHTKATQQLPHEAQAYWQCQSLEGRCQILTATDSVIGSAFNRIKDAVARGFQDDMLFIEFDDLCRQPKDTLERVYSFLGEAAFEHDFNNVVQVTQEDDVAYVWKDLHKIRPKVEPVQSRWRQVLQSHISDAMLNTFTRDAFFWRHLT